VKALQVIARQAAERDIADAVGHYLKEGGALLAVGFIDALESAFRHLGTQSLTGSPRYAIDLDLPGLRSWQMGRFPYLIFYRVQPDHVDVWRVLHAQRDIPVSLRDELQTNSKNRVQEKAVSGYATW
jgi:toxin ParE1/3/4